MFQRIFMSMSALCLLTLPAYADNKIQVAVSTKVTKDGIELSVYGKISDVPAGSRVRIQLKRDVRTTAQVGHVPTLDTLIRSEKSGFKLEQTLDRDVFLPGRYILTVSVDFTQSGEDVAREKAPPPQEPIRESREVWIGTASERVGLLGEQQKRLWQDIKEIEKLVGEYEIMGEPLPKRAGLYGKVYEKQLELNARHERVIFPWSYEVLGSLLRFLPVAAPGESDEKHKGMYGGIPPKGASERNPKDYLRKLLDEAKSSVAREVIAALVEELACVVDAASRVAETASDKKIPEAVRRGLKEDLAAIESSDKQARKADFGEVYTAILKDDKGNDRLSSLITLARESVDTVQDAERKEEIARFQKAGTELLNRISKVPVIQDVSSPHLPR